MSAAEDCGVTGGCRACPLFAANVCGDPAPGGCPGCNGAGRLTDVLDEDRFAECPDCAGSGKAEHSITANEAPDVDPAEPRPEGFGCCGGACIA